MTDYHNREFVSNYLLDLLLTFFFFRVLISVFDYSNYYHAPAVVLGPLIGTAARTCLESPAL